MRYAACSFPPHRAANHPLWPDLVAAYPPIAGNPTRPADDLATIIYTSGTTGTPKGVMHRFCGFSFDARIASRHLELTVDQRILSYLPLAHIVERAGVEACSFRLGSRIFFTEGVETFLADLHRAGPTIFLSVPRLLLKFQQGVLAKVPSRKLNLLLRIPIVGGDGQEEDSASAWTRYRAPRGLRSRAAAARDPAVVPQAGPQPGGGLRDDRDHDHPPPRRGPGAPRLCGAGPRRRRDQAGGERRATGSQPHEHAGLLQGPGGHQRRLHPGRLSSGPATSASSTPTASSRSSGASRSSSRPARENTWRPLPSRAGSSRTRRWTPAA